MHNFSNLFRFSPSKWKVKLRKGCLWMCKHKHIQKVPEQHFFNYFLKNKLLKNPTLILWGTQILILSEVRHEKTKPSRWVERSPKMRYSHRCHCLQKFIKYEKKTQKHTNWGSSAPLPQRVRTGNKMFFCLSLGV